MLDKPEIFVRSRSFGRTRREDETVSANGRAVVVEYESLMGTGSTSVKNAPKLRNVLFEHEEQLVDKSRAPGSYVPKQKTPEKEPGCYVPKGSKQPATTNAQNRQSTSIKTPTNNRQFKKETTPTNNKTRKETTPRSNRLKEKTPEMVGPIKILRRDPTKARTTPANNRLRQNKPPNATTKKEVNPLLDDDDDFDDIEPVSTNIKSVKKDVPKTKAATNENPVKATLDKESVNPKKKNLQVDSRSKDQNKKKTARKKEKLDVKTDVDTNNEPGSLFTRQWPKIPHIFEAESFLDLCDEEVLVSEKIDGSNMAISNRNYITSRRNILLNNPTTEELKKYKFSGQKMNAVFDLVPKINLLHDKFQNFFPFLEMETFLYGELVQAGTATSKEDKYDYKSKGFQAGDFVCFGCGISFQDNLDDDQLLVAKKHLVSKGYNVMIVEDGETSSKYLVLLMNDILTQIIKSVGITQIISNKKMKFESCLKEYCKKLENDDVEGAVCIFTSAIFKWKGVAENYPDLYMEQIKNLKKEVKSKKPGKEKCVEYLETVALAARKLREKCKSEKLAQGGGKNTAAWTQTLESAFKSAASKYALPTEQWGNMKISNEKKKELKQEYITNIKQEIIQDLNESGSGKGEKNLEAIVQQFLNIKIK